MTLAAPSPDPTDLTIATDRMRVGYAVFGATALLFGIWLAWLVGYALDWPISDLGIEPRQWGGLIGILTAPLVHGSFEHLVSNTMPLGLMTALALYAYPLATRRALPAIWLLSGLLVWVFARPSFHIGISGIVHGLMFFLFVIGLLRRDRLAVAITLAVFFLYGGMVMTVLPREQSVSFEYHAAGAFIGLLAAIALRKTDPPPARKRYDWEDETGDDDAIDDELELPSPREVPVLWNRESDVEHDGRIIQFRPRPRDIN
ncbi:MAG: rhomboid family intramembrane serine protease [Dokdonella sp.]